MAASGRAAPPKPWERPGAQANTGPSPFAPSSTTTSSSLPDDNNNNNKLDLSSVRTVPVTDAAENRAMPLRPWERSGATTTGYGYGATGYGATGYGATGYGATGYGYSPYNRPYNTYGGYGTGGYGGYSSGYGGGMYGTGGYGGGMYNNRFGYGMGPPMLGYGNQMNNPNDPNGEGPPRPPNFWQTMLSVLHGTLNFFGRIAMLIDENTQAFHFFISALLQLCDRAGVLYGELARFVLRLLGFRPRPRARSLAAAAAAAAGGRAALPSSDKQQQQQQEPQQQQQHSGTWDSVWGSDTAK